jgi:hypothetical protein
MKNGAVLTRSDLYPYWNDYMNALEMALSDGKAVNLWKLRLAKSRLVEVIVETQRLAEAKVKEGKEIAEEPAVFDMDVYYLTSIHPKVVQVKILKDWHNGWVTVEALEGEPFDMSGMAGSFMRNQATVYANRLRAHGLEERSKNG